MNLRVRVLPAFEKAGIQVTVHETEYAGHARDLAASVPVAGYDGFVVVGGDGTIHEAVNGMLARADKQSMPIGVR